MPGNDQRSKPIFCYNLQCCKNLFILAYAACLAQDLILWRASKSIKESSCQSHYHCELPLLTYDSNIMLIKLELLKVSYLEAEKVLEEESFLC